MINNKNKRIEMKKITSNIKQFHKNLKDTTTLTVTEDEMMDILLWNINYQKSPKRILFDDFALIVIKSDDDIVFSKSGLMLTGTITHFKMNLSDHGDATDISVDIYHIDSNDLLVSLTIDPNYFDTGEILTINGKEYDESSMNDDHLVYASKYSLENILSTFQYMFLESHHIIDCTDTNINQVSNERTVKVQSNNLNFDQSNDSESKMYDSCEFQIMSYEDVTNFKKKIPMWLKRGYWSYFDSIEGIKYINTDDRLYDRRYYISKIRTI